MFTRRVLISMGTGAVLGVICVIGAQIRSGFEQEAVYLAAFWYNRVIMGLVIGLAPRITGGVRLLLRGALLGLLVSFAFFISAGMNDVIGLVAGIIYGIIIEYVGSRFSSK